MFKKRGAAIWTNEPSVSQALTPEPVQSQGLRDLALHLRSGTLASPAAPSSARPSFARPALLAALPRGNASGLAGREAHRIFRPAVGSAQAKLLELASAAENGDQIDSFLSFVGSARDNATFL